MLKDFRGIKITNGDKADLEQLNDGILLCVDEETDTVTSEEVESIIDKEIHQILGGTVWRG